APAGSRILPAVPGTPAVSETVPRQGGSVFRSTSVRQRLAAAALLVAATVPSVLSAQNKFSVTPWVGSFFSIADFYNDEFDLTVIGGTGTTNITVSQENTAMFGLRVSLPVSATIAA